MLRTTAGDEQSEEDEADEQQGDAALGEEDPGDVEGDESADEQHAEGDGEGDSSAASGDVHGRGLEDKPGTESSEMVYIIDTVKKNP